MLLIQYFAHSIIERTTRYLILMTAIFSVLELIRGLALLPVLLPFPKILTLWVLAWPTAGGIALPLCFFLALVITRLHFAQTQELAIMQFLMRPRHWVYCLITPIGVFSGIMLFVSGWLNPLCLSAKQEIIDTFMQSAKMPQAIAGQFNHMQFGGNQLVIFPSKEKRDLLFLAIDLGQSSDTQILQAEKISLKREQGAAVLEVHQGKSYQFDNQHRLRQTVTFKNTQLPLSNSKKQQEKKIFFKTLTELTEVHSAASWVEALWRCLQPIAVITLSVVAMTLGNYLQCRRKASSVRWQAGALGVGYYLGLFFIYNKSYGMQDIWLVVLMYATASACVIMISLVLNRASLISYGK